MASQTINDESAGSDLEEPQSKKSNGKRKMTTWRFLRKVIKGGKSVWKPLLFIFMNGVYLLLGAVVFLVLERKEDTVQFNISTEISEILQAFNETIPDVINLPHSSLGIQEFAGNMTANDLDKWKTVLETIYQRRIITDTPPWTLSRSIFFCTSLLTTIGYGNIAPATTLGRIFCILYSFIGIPFNIMLLAVLGKSMAGVINKFVAQFIRLWTNYLHPNYEWKSLEDQTQINAPVWLALIIFASFLCFCAGIYSVSEGWDYWTACYFTFITFTTIGLGDIVPERTETMILIDTTLLYVGLAVLALTVNLIVANVVYHAKKTREKLPFVDRLEMSSVTSDSNGE